MDVLGIHLTWLQQIIFHIPDAYIFLQWKKSNIKFLDPWNMKESLFIKFKHGDFNLLFHVIDSNVSV